MLLSAGMTGEGVDVGIEDVELGDGLGEDLGDGLGEGRGDGLGLGLEFIF